MKNIIIVNVGKHGELKCPYCNFQEEFNEATGEFVGDGFLKTDEDTHICPRCDKASGED